MISTKYSEAVVDVLDILEHMEEEDIQRVPKKFVDILKENASPTYVSNLDYTKRLVEMDLSEEARGILAVMYRHYWCPKEKKEEFEKRITENEMEFQRIISEKYSTEEIFVNKGNIVSEEKIINDLTEEEALVEVPEKSFWEKIVSKVISIFRK